MLVLLIEDDFPLGEALATGLRQAGFVVDWVRDGCAADQALLSAGYGLVVLDLGLPGLSGMEVLRRLRARGQELPVLILTARDELGDKVAGLDAGADDYLVKPVELGELTARLRAWMRRRGGRTSMCLEHGDLVLDPGARTVHKAGVPVELSVREFSLLQVLLEHVGRVLSRSQLEQALYGWDGEPESNALEVHVHHLRRKLGNELIRTLRGVGYSIPKAPA